MNLEPKARPVQISKINFSGIDILTKQDLLKNFYVSEIINLDSKFVAWLRRKAELVTYADDVEKILQDYKISRNKEMVAKALLSTFFNEELKSEDTGEFLLELFLNIDISRIIDDFIECIDINCTLIRFLINRGTKWVFINHLLSLQEKRVGINDIKDKDEWGKLFFELSKQVNIDRERRYGYLKKAYDLGYSKADTNQLRDYLPDQTIITIGAQTLKMLKISDDSGVYYISRDFFKSEGTENILSCRINSNYSSCTQYDVYNLLRYLNDSLNCIEINDRKVKVKWLVPTFAQITEFKTRYSISICYLGSGEWCLQNGEYRCVTAQGPVKFSNNSRISLLFRPVFKVLNNKL